MRDEAWGGKRGGKRTESRNGSSTANRRRRRPQLEALEGRLVLTSIVVQTAGDVTGLLTPTGPGAYTAPTLRAAIDAYDRDAASLGSEVDITFAPALAGATIHVATESQDSAGFGPTALAIVPLTIVPVPLTISGDAARGITIEGDGNGRLFATYGAYLTLDNMTLSGGVAVGGAGGYGAGGGGGGAGLGGALESIQSVISMENCLITDNAAQGGNGGEGNAAFGAGGGGSAAYPGGSAVDNTQFGGAGAGGGGTNGPGQNSNGTDDNTPGNGGANQDGQQVGPDGSGSLGGGGAGGKHTDNGLFHVNYSGGNGTNTNSIGFGGGGGGGNGDDNGPGTGYGFGHGGAAGYGAGGGGGALGVGGPGGWGGGGGGAGSLPGLSSQAGGTGGFGAGNGGNGGQGGGGGGGGLGAGGAIFVSGGLLNLTNVTFTDNRATGGNGGGLGFNNGNIGQDGSGYGGAIFSNSAQVQINDCTISNNTASTGGSGVYVYGSSSSAPNSLHVANSILGPSGMAGATDFASSTAPGAKAPVITGSNNLITVRGTFPLAALVAIADPQLGPLADNGGPTLTMLPLPGSPVIDAGTFFPGGAAGALPATDQRGGARVAGRTVDLGAVETTFATTGSTIGTVPGLVAVQTHEAKTKRLTRSAVELIFSGTITPKGNAFRLFSQRGRVPVRTQVQHVDGLTAVRLEFAQDSLGRMSTARGRYRLVVAGARILGSGGAFLGGRARILLSHLQGLISGDVRS